jgi:glutamyl-tRNA synthetase
MRKEKIGEKKILAYALKNAIEHGGEAKLNSVLNSLFHEGLEKSQIKKTIPIIQGVVKQVNSLPVEEQEKQFSGLKKETGKRKEREGLPELPNAKKGKVVTRMSPSPSGPLHIGHILTILPNFLYAKKYKGRFYIRIEDTNPENIYKPAYKMIEQEARWLCKGKVKIVIQSERIKLYYKYAEKLINKNAVYVCDCKPEEFKQLILKKTACPCRNLSKKKQLERWKKMLDKGKEGYKEGEAVVRFKSDMKDKNPAMRDFPLARINTSNHPLQKKKYRVWPLMNLAVTVDDIEQGMTHIIRGKEHRDNEKRQRMIYKILGKKYPWTAYLGRLHFKDLVLSASKIRKSIEEGKYKGWGDERLPTAASLKKRGYKPEAFWKLSEQFGISEVDKVMEKKEFFKLLDQFNK